MIVLVDSSEDIAAVSAELGMECEQMLTPLTRFHLRSRRFGVDNGGFQRPDVPGLLSLLERERPNPDRCLFVAVPDVIASARRTLEVFDRLAGRIAVQGWPLALVAQDGQEDLPVPWDDIAAVFIGGSTEWKMGRHAEAVIRAAQVLGKWVHVGRVNTPARMTRFEEMGVDSVDGTGISRYSWMRKAVADRRLQPALILVTEAAA